MTQTPNTSDQQTCICCGQSIRTFNQARFTGGVMTLGDCQNRSCVLFGVTLSVDHLAALTPDEIAAYAAASESVCGNGGGGWDVTLDAASPVLTLPPIPAVVLDENAIYAAHVDSLQVAEAEYRATQNEDALTCILLRLQNPDYLVRFDAAETLYLLRDVAQGDKEVIYRALSEAAYVDGYRFSHDHMVTAAAFYLPPTDEDED